MQNKQKMDSHKEKVKMARKMLTSQERKKFRTKDGRKIGVSIFQSKAWNKRRNRIQERIIENEIARESRRVRKEDMEKEKQLVQM